MLPRSSSTPTSFGQPPAAVTGVHDTCIRCGRPTPLGVALCDADNPGRIKGPSATQVHGTIVLGLIGGFLLFALLAALAGAGVGPFRAAVVGEASLADGSTEIVVSVTNEGSRSSAASCRLSRGGVTGGSDAVFFSEVIPAGATREFNTRLRPPAGEETRLGAIAVRCN